MKTAKFRVPHRDLYCDLPTLYPEFWTHLECLFGEALLCPEGSVEPHIEKCWYNEDAKNFERSESMSKSTVKRKGKKLVPLSAGMFAERATLLTVDDFRLNFWVAKDNFWEDPRFQRLSWLIPDEEDAHRATGSIALEIEEPYYGPAGIRPVLEYGNRGPRFMRRGEQLLFDGMTWTVIQEGVAICETVIDWCHNLLQENKNVWETVDLWFEDAMKRNPGGEVFLLTEGEEVWFENARLPRKEEIPKSFRWMNGQLYFCASENGIDGISSLTGTEEEYQNELSMFSGWAVGVRPMLTAHGGALTLGDKLELNGEILTYLGDDRALCDAEVLVKHVEGEFPLPPEYQKVVEVVESVNEHFFDAEYMESQLGHMNALNLYRNPAKRKELEKRIQTDIRRWFGRIRN